MAKPNDDVVSTVGDKRLNRINLRKDFFKSEIDTICEIVERNHGKVDYVATPAALEYRDTSDMSDGAYNAV